MVVQTDLEKIRGCSKLIRGYLEMDCDTYICLWKGKKVRLNATAFAAVWDLALRPGVVKTNDYLFEHYTGIECETRFHMGRVRDEFKRVDRSFDAIESIYGIGYRFKVIGEPRQIYEELSHYSEIYAYDIYQ